MQEELLSLLLDAKGCFQGCQALNTGNITTAALLVGHNCVELYACILQALHQSILNILGWGEKLCASPLSEL